MNKTKEATQQPKTVESSQPAFVDELLKNGTVIITALSREELPEIVNEIPADCKYAVGAVGHNPATGVFSLRVDLC